MKHAPSSPVTYVLIYVMLLGLTILTVAVANTAHLGPWEIPVALGIASVKTVLVGYFFMHLNHTGRLTYLVILAGVVFLAVMVGLTMIDYKTRNWPGLTPTGLPPASPPPVPVGR